MKKIKRVFSVMLGSCVLLAPYVWGAPSLDESVVLLAQRMADNLTKTNLCVVIGKLTLEHSEFSSEFADRYLDLLKVELKRNSNDFKEVKRGMITRSMLTRGGLFSSESLEAETRTEVKLEGIYTENKESGVLTIFAKFVDNDGKTISSSEVQVDRSTIPWSTKPPNLEKIQKTEQEIDNTPKVTKNFDLEIWTDKGSGGIYREGEKMKVMVKTPMDCFVKVLYVDAGGNRILMYPTERDIVKKLLKGEVYNLNENNDYEIVPPFGSEMILAFASTEPFEKNSSEAKEIELGGGFTGFAAKDRMSEIVAALRGIKVGEKKGLRAEAKIYITTVKGR